MNILNQMPFCEGFFWQKTQNEIIISDQYNWWSVEIQFGQTKTIDVGDNIYEVLSTPAGLLVIGSYIEYSQEERSWEIVYPNGEKASMEALYCRDEFFDELPDLKEKWEKEYENLHFGIPKVKFSYNMLDV